MNMSNQLITLLILIVISSSSGSNVTVVTSYDGKEYLKAVGLILLQDRDTHEWKSLCSGSWIGQDKIRSAEYRRNHYVFLTAAHCVYQRMWINAMIRHEHLKYIKVQFGVLDGKSEVECTVEDMIINTKWPSWSEKKRAFFGNNDYAILILVCPSKPAPEPLKIKVFKNTKGQPFQRAGFTGAKTLSVANEKRLKTAKYKKFKTDEIVRVKTGGQYDKMLITKGDAGKGDSGGPMLDGDHEIRAIAQALHTDPTVEKGDKNRYTGLQLSIKLYQPVIDDINQMTERKSGYSFLMKKLTSTDAHSEYDNEYKYGEYAYANVYGEDAFYFDRNLSSYRYSNQYLLYINLMVLGLLMVILLCICMSIICLVVACIYHKKRNDMDYSYDQV
eukprot:432579_1